MIDLKWLGDITGWFSVEQREKKKRVKRDALKIERRKLLKQRPTTVQITKRIMKIDDELEVIERDLGN